MILSIKVESKVVRLEIVLAFKAQCFNSIVVRLERLFQTTLGQFYHGIINRVKTFFDIFDFWIALQSFWLQCKSA